MGVLNIKSYTFEFEVSSYGPVKELNDLEGVTIDTENYKIRRKRKSVPDNWENDETENSENVDPCIATKLENEEKLMLLIPQVIELLKDTKSVC